MLPLFNLSALKCLMTATIGLFLLSCSLVEPKETLSYSSTETQRRSLDGEWSFQIDPYKKGLKQEWWRTELDVSHWDRIQVPGVWDTYDRYNEYTGDAWYRLEFKGTPKELHAQIDLVFDSVYHDSEVWLNNERLGENHLGFMPFHFDISNKINKDSSNTLVVRVNNRFKRGAVWNWGGIRRPVYLSIKPLTHIKKVYVTPEPDLKTGSATVHLRTVVNNFSDNSDTATLNYRILRNGQDVIVADSAPFKLASKGDASELESTLTLSPQQVALWHFNAPKLYEIEATLSVGEHTVHRFNDRFGIRKVEVDEKGLYLNGEQVRLAGFNMVPEDRFDGNALPLSRIKEDVDLLKALNANFARLSGPVLPKEYLNYLDEVGFLLVEEVGLWGKDSLVDPDHPLPKEWLKRLVDDHYNHPSVIAWSVGNEIGDTNKNPKVMAYVEGAIAHAKALDPTRLAVYISYSADYQESDPSKFSDIVMFNKYGDHEERLKVVHGYYPDKPIFFSEIGTNLDGVDPNESIYDPIKVMEPLRKHPYLIGTSHFAFSDYRSTWYDEKPEWTTDFSQNRAWGVLTSYRTPKRSFKALQDFFSPLETLRVSHSGSKHTISLKSRSLDSFPAYTMDGYRIVWLAEDAQGKRLDAGQIILPTVTPGSEAKAFDFETQRNYAKLSLNLLDPSGYVSQKVAYYAQAPLAPSITSVRSSLDTIRTHFKKSSLTEEYQLLATAANGKVIKGKKTINDFAEVSGLEPNQPYTIELISHNDFGTSTNNKRHVVSTSPNELPPIIWATEGKENAFHVGFSVGRNDFTYEIQYGLQTGQYTEQFLVGTRGATRVPAIKAGHDHYFRFRRLITGSIDSDWSEEYKVELTGKNGLNAPQDAYAIAGEQGTVIGFSPTKGATGYKLEIEFASGELMHIDTTTAYSEFVLLKGVDLSTTKRISIATIDNQGRLGRFEKVSF